MVLIFIFCRVTSGVGYINARMAAQREKLFETDNAIAQIEIKLNQAIANSLNKIESGYEIAQKTEEALQSIVQSSIKVSDLVAEVSSASDEQAIRVSQILQKFQLLDRKQG
jgi:methyl-accepting chemotaxis protein